MSAPDELRQLADRLDIECGWDEQRCVADEPCRQDNCTICAAAVALRHHANLLDAIGDPDDLRTAARYGAVEHSAASVALYRIAAAVSPPAPTTQENT